MKRSSFVFLVLFVFIFSGNVFAGSIKEIEASITKAVTEYLIEKEPSFVDAEIKIKYSYSWRIFNKLSKRKGKLEFEVAELYPGFKPLGSVIVPIQVVDNGAPKEKVFLRSKISVVKDVVVANRSIRKREIVADKDVRLVERDIARVYTKKYFISSEEVIGKEAKTYIPRNYIVVGWMVKVKSLVQKRGKVKIKASVKDISVVADGVAMEDGAKGAKIKVKNMSSNKIIEAIVVSSREVVIENL